jgi:hypothetical protein
LHHSSNDWKNIIIAQKHLVANFQLPNLERICCLARKKIWLSLKTILVTTQKQNLVIAQNISVAQLMVAQSTLVSS